MDAGGASMNKLTVELHLGDCLEVMAGMKTTMGGAGSLRAGL